MKFALGSPDPFEVFGINHNELPDIPEDPPLPVIPPPKKRLSLKNISKKGPKENNQVLPGQMLLWPNLEAAAQPGLYPFKIVKISTFVHCMSKDIVHCGV